ncbi:MAG TPA: peptidylprolyl isomerase [Candidatus Acidoferrum sp.]|nr:peptidylprolyl isomerase [Candidatus Acidoferrum sp.]
MSEASVNQRLTLRDLDAQSASVLPRYAPDAVRPGAGVTLHFALKLDAQQVIDSNFGKEPASFVLGDGNMLPGFERALLGRRAGDEIECVIAAADAFGAVNPDNVQRFPRFRFPPDLALSENLLVEFADASGYQQAGRVISIDKQYVEVDFNHPLAGRDIAFSARILAVEPPHDGE